jgi:hypothetical protein
LWKVHGGPGPPQAHADLGIGHGTRDRHEPAIGMSQEPGFTVEAAHARDKEKDVVYPPVPFKGTPDYDALRRRVLQATEQTRGNLGES